MFKFIDLSEGLIKKFLAILFLCGAAYSSYNVGNLMSHFGIAYYGICILALLKDCRRATLLLWAAVGAHIILSGYSLWNWHYSQIKPCHYCFAAAGLVLSAATARTRLKALVIPVMIMLGMWQTWPFVFSAGGDSANTVTNHQELQKSQIIEAVSDSAMEQQKPPASSAAAKNTAPEASPAPAPPPKTVNSSAATIKNTVPEEPVQQAGTGIKEDLPAGDDELPKSSESG